MSAEFCSMLHWSIKCGAHWLLCCGFLSRHIASYPSQGRAPWLWELWWGFFILKGFVPKMCVPEPLCNEQGSELLAPWTITRLLNSHHCIVSLLFDILSPLLACSPLPSKSVFQSISIFSMIIHRRKTIVASFLFFVLIHSKFKFWGDKYSKYVFNLTWWITMSEDLSALPSKKFLLYCSYSRIFCLWEILITSILVSITMSHFISFRMTEEFSCLWNLNN